MSNNLDQTRKCLDKCNFYDTSKAFIQQDATCLCYFDSSKQLQLFNKNLESQLKLANKPATLGFKTQIKFQYYKQTFMGANKYYNLIQNLNVNDCLNECLLDSDSTNGCIGVSVNQTHCFLYKDLIYLKEANHNINSYILPYSMGFTIESFALKSHYFNITEKTLEACVRKCLMDQKCDYITYRQFKSINDLTCKFSSNYHNSELHHHVLNRNQIKTDSDEDLYEDNNSNILIMNSKKKHYDLYEMNNTKFERHQEDAEHSFYTKNSLQCWFHCDIDIECQAASFLQNQPIMSIESFSNCFLFKKGVALQVESNLKTNLSWVSYMNVKGFEKMSSVNVDLSEHFEKQYFLYSPSNQIERKVNLTDCLDYCTNTDNCMSVLFDKSNLNCILYKGVPSTYHNDDESNQVVNFKRDDDHRILLINTNRVLGLIYIFTIFNWIF